MSDATNVVLTTEEMVKAGYRKMRDQAFELQQRIVLTVLARNEFGTDMLPVYDFYRNTLYDLRCIGLYTEEYDKRLAEWRQQHASLIAKMRILENLFAEAKAHDDAAWTTAMADFLRRRRAGEE